MIWKDISWRTLLANLDGKGTFWLSAFPFPTVPKKCGVAHSSLIPAFGKETALEHHTHDAHTLHARHSYLGSFRHCELVMDTVSWSFCFHSKWIEETKTTPITVLKFVLIVFWFVQLVHVSVHYAAFVITPPYTSDSQIPGHDAMRAKQRKRGEWKCLSVLLDVV